MRADAAFYSGAAFSLPGDEHAVMARPTALTVVGARPQFIKAAPLSRALRRRLREVLVHTGQHYDRAMSQAFFEELHIPPPDRHLGVGSGSHARMTGAMLERLEAVMLEVKPDVVVVLGDTNSTLAGALAAAKLQIPVAHVEAGLRSFDARMPEELNRRLTDHVSELLFCPTPVAVRNLRREGITRGVHLVGDVTRDAIAQNLLRARRLDVATPPRGSFYLATLHRPENSDDPRRLRAILGALGALDRPVLLPLHPRTRERLRRFGLAAHGSLRLRPPLSYLEMLRMLRNAAAVLTDSGGVQKEAFVLGTPCITLRETTEWTETLAGGRNRLVGADPRKIAAAVRAAGRLGRQHLSKSGYGGGHAAERIARLIACFLRAKRRAR